MEILVKEDTRAPLVPHVDFRISKISRNKEKHHLTTNGHVKKKRPK